MENEAEHLKNIFAWTGLQYMLRNSHKEDFKDILEFTQEMLVGICLAAKHYTGNNTQIKAGYTEIIESVPTLLAFSPNLSEKLAETW